METEARAFLEKHVWEPDFVEFTHFRAFYGKTAYKVREKIKTKDQLIDYILRNKPAAMYYTPSKFLNPEQLGKRSEEITQNFFLFSPEFIIDIDIQLLDGNSIQEFMKYAHEVVNSYISIIKDIDFNTLNFGNAFSGKLSLQFRFVAFSGGKGFHIHYSFPYQGIRGSTPVEKEENTKKVKKQIAEYIASIVQKQGLPLFDIVVSWDTRRIVRLPGTVHQKTGYMAQIVKPEEIKDFVPQKYIYAPEKVKVYGIQ